MGVIRAANLRNEAIVIPTEEELPSNHNHYLNCINIAGYIIPL